MNIKQQYGPTLDTDLSGLLEFAVSMAQQAGRETLRYFGADVSAQLKADSTPVTQADRDAEQLCRALIEARFPTDGIIGEEFGTSRPEAPRRWIIDPIDGTKNFIRGVPLYGVLIALEEAGRPVLGVVHFPALSDTVAAARGSGCYWNGRLARVSEVSALKDALVLSTDAESFAEQGHAAEWEQLVGRAAMARTWGDCYGHALVATGRAEAMLDPVLAIWDSAALLPIVEEAGGVFSDWAGRQRHDGGSGISTNSALAKEIRGLLGVGHSIPNRTSSSSCPDDPVAQ